MAQIAGFHHVSLPSMDAERSADWYERVFGFECVLIEEEEDRVKAVMLEHPAGMLLSVPSRPIWSRGGTGRPARLQRSASGSAAGATWRAGING